VVEERILMTDIPDNKALLTFPCRYVLKITAIAAEMTLEAVLTLLKPHIPEVAAADVAVKNSSQGKYISFSVSFTAQNQQQLDALYRDLTTHKEIVFVL
jgi:putative lipoic acid-binding regulatory protein